MLSPPLLICLDVQRVFLEPGRFYTPNGARVLMHGRRLLDHARNERWQVAHCLLRPPAAPVAMNRQAARPVEGFEPLTREMVFERESLSAYGHPDFDRVVAKAEHGAIVIGLSASLTFLATSIDAFERGQRLLLARDAMAAPAGIEAGAQSHEAVARDIARFLGFSVGQPDAATPEHAALEAPTNPQGAHK